MFLQGRPTLRSGGGAGADKSSRSGRGSSATDRSALVVGADPATLRLCSGVLEGSGFAVEVVDSGMEAVVAARQRTPVLILIASQLSDVPGREAVHWLRSNPALRLTPVIILAAYAEKDKGMDGSGPSVILQKPYSAQDIRKAVTRLVR